VKIQKPKKLLPGDKIGIVALSDITDDEKIAKSVHYLEEMGYKVVQGKTLGFYSHGRSAGSGIERLDDALDTVSQGVKAIVLAVGGWSASDVMAEMLTKRAFRAGLYRVIQRRILERPIIWSGYSDNLYWQNWLLAAGGIPSLHGLHAQGLLDWSDNSRNLWWDWLTKPEPHTFGSDQKWRVYQGKIGQKPRGMIIPTNLDCLSRVAGMKYLDPTVAYEDEDLIVVLEDYDALKSDILRTFDSLIFSWILNKQIGRIQAVIVGRFVQSKEDPAGYREWESAFWDDIVSRLAPFKIPVVRWGNFGHSWSEEARGDDFVSMPIGVHGELEIVGPNNCKLTVDPLVID
jgi:muramoyltetrapeptide carboxypeptidase